jgi:hypothetical protein
VLPRKAEEILMVLRWATPEEPHRLKFAHVAMLEAQGFATPPDVHSTPIP